MPDRELNDQEKPVGKLIHNDEEVSEEEQDQIDRFEQEDFDRRDWNAELTAAQRYYHSR